MPTPGLLRSRTPPGVSGRPKAQEGSVYREPFFHPLRPGLALMGLATLLLILPACDSEGVEGGITEPTPTPTLSLSLDPTDLEVEAGASASVSATVTRGGGYAGMVELEVSDAGDHLEVEVGEPQAVGATLRFPLEVRVHDEAPEGLRTLSLRARGSGGLEATGDLTVTALAPPQEPGPEVLLDLSACGNDATPVWIAVWNGRDAWQRAQPEGDQVAFRMARDQEVGGFAWVTGQGGWDVSVQLATVEELTAFPQALCSPGGSATATASVEGLQESHYATLFLGGGRGSAHHSIPDTRVTGILEGVHDLLAYRGSLIEPGCADRILIRRDVEVEDGGHLGVVDFRDEAAFPPATARVTLTGAGPGQKAHLMGYYTGEGCVGGEMALHPPRLVEGGAFTIRGVPGAEQRPTDMHQLTVTEVDGTLSRLTAHFFREMADREVELWAPITPQLSDVDGAHRRLAMDMRIPSQYLTGETAAVSLTFGTGVLTFTTSATVAALGGQEDVALATTELSSVEGWDATWAPAPGATVQWTVQLTSASTLQAVRRRFCTEEAWVRMAGASGSR